MMAHGAMFCAFYVYYDFFSYDTATAYDNTGEGSDEMAGGHAVTCYGWGLVQVLVLHTPPAPRTTRMDALPRVCMCVCMCMSWTWT